jgi:predicted regulator of Ras-like GTPase activity (Roadblock/LC7/MglB family)
VTPSPTIEALTEVARLRGVRAAIVVSPADGLCVASIAHVRVDVEALAAFVTSVVRRAALAAASPAHGAVRLLALDATDGRLLAAVRPDLMLVALTERASPPAPVRLALQRALERVS